MALSARSLAPVLDKLKAALRVGPEMQQRVAAQLEEVPKRVTAHLEQLREGGPAKVFAELFARGRAPRQTVASRCSADAVRGGAAPGTKGPASRIVPRAEASVTQAPPGGEADATFRELFEGREAEVRERPARTSAEVAEQRAPTMTAPTPVLVAAPSSVEATPLVGAEPSAPSGGSSAGEDSRQVHATKSESFAELIGSADAQAAEPSVAERVARDAALEEPSAARARAGRPRERRSARPESPPHHAAPAESPVEAVASRDASAKSTRPLSAPSPKRSAAARAKQPATRGAKVASKPSRATAAAPRRATSEPAPASRFARLGAAASAGRVVFVGAQERVPLRTWVTRALGAPVPWVARGQVGTRGVTTVEASLQSGGLSAVVLLEGDISHKESERIVATCKKCHVPFAYAGRGSHKALEEAFAKLERELG